MSARVKVTEPLYRVVLTHELLGVVRTEGATLAAAAEIRLRLEADLPTWVIELEKVLA